MAAPVYYQNEVDEIIAAPKWIPAEASTMLADRKAKRSERVCAHIKQTRLPLELETPVTGVTLEIEMVQNLLTDSVSFLLWLEIWPRPWMPIVRYDADDNRHRNESFCPGGERIIGPGEFHRHLYCEQSIREDRTWDSCAEAIDLPADQLSPRQMLDRLRNKFLTDLSIRFSDSAGHRSLFDFPQK